MYGVSNEHIVQLKAICATPVAMMLEYLYFDFGSFGIKHRISYLQDFLDLVSTDDDYAVRFSCLHAKIAEDVYCPQGLKTSECSGFKPALL